MSQGIETKISRAEQTLRTHRFILHVSTPILNTLLAILNERVFRRGHTKEEVPLRVCVGASNALPEDEGGIPWIATNTDWTIPQARGIAPGNGTLVSAVHTAVGRLAVVAGKPERPIFDEAVDRFGARHPLFIGDRLDTDIAGAQAAGIDSVLVLTGVDRPKHVLAAPTTSRPTFIVGDLRELHEPYPETIVDGDVTTVGDASVRIDGPDVRILRTGERPVDLVRAGAAAIWATGRAIYGFRVPERLYADPFHRP